MVTGSQATNAWAVALSHRSFPGADGPPVIWLTDILKSPALADDVAICKLYVPGGIQSICVAAPTVKQPSPTAVVPQPVTANVPAPLPVIGSEPVPVTVNSIPLFPASTVTVNHTDAS